MGAPLPDNLAEPAVLLASTLSLMTSFARIRCPRQATLITRQLAYLQSYPDHLVPATLKATARRLQQEWEHLLARLEPGVAAASCPRRRLH